MEVYRGVTFRDSQAFSKLTADAVCFVFKQTDLFDMDEVTGAMGWMPDWKRYMTTGKWPWDDIENGGGDNDGEDDDNDDEEEDSEDDE